MEKYLFLIGFLIVGYIILLYITKKQANIIKDKDQTIDILNSFYKTLKDTCECCNALHNEEIKEYKEQICADEVLMNRLRKRLDEAERW
jgi:hypothetical protein